MNTKRKTSGMLGLLLAFGLAGGGMSIAISESGGSAHSSNEVLLNANTLIGNTVVDNLGKELGTVKDLLINQMSGQISHIVLSYGGAFSSTLGIGSENYSIPWNEVKLTKQDDKMVVQVAEAPIGQISKTRDHASIRNSQDIATRNNEFNP